MGDQNGTTVFDMESLTVTQTRQPRSALSTVPGILKDAAQAAQIADRNFLRGCPGVDTKLVHGQRWQQITGDMHEKIDGFCKTSIYGGEDHYVMPEQKVTVQGNLLQTIAGGVTSMVVGPYTGTQMGPCTISYVAPMTEIHASSKSIVETHKFETEVVETKVVWAFEYVGITGLKVETITAKVSVGAIKADVYALHAISEAIKTKLHLLEAGGAALEAKLGLRVKVQPTGNGAPEVAMLVP